jgi:hypothetical protein
MTSDSKKSRLLCSFLISSVANDSVLATGFRQLLTRASIVTRYDVGGESFGVPGSRFGNMTNRENSADRRTSQLLELCVRNVPIPSLSLAYLGNS